MASHWLKEEEAQERQAGDRQSVLHSGWALCQSRVRQECRRNKAGNRGCALGPAQIRRACVGLSGLGTLAAAFVGVEVQAPGFPASLAAAIGDFSDKRW